MPMDPFIQAISKKTCLMGLARKLSLMDPSMWDNFPKACSRAKASLSGQTVLNMKDSGKQMK